MASRSKDSRPHVIVVEDEQFQRETLVDFLDDRGYRSTGVDSGSALRKLVEKDPPALVLLGALTVVRPSPFATVQQLLDTGLPVWLSFRRCRHGLCSLYGQHWGGPEGDAFGRAAARFETMGAGALMINCIPPDHVDGITRCVSTSKVPTHAKRKSPRSTAMRHARSKSSFSLPTRTISLLIALTTP